MYSEGFQALGGKGLKLFDGFKRASNGSVDPLLLPS